MLTGKGLLQLGTASGSQYRSDVTGYGPASTDATARSARTMTRRRGRPDPRRGPALAVVHDQPARPRAVAGRDDHHYPRVVQRVDRARAPQLEVAPETL